MPIPFRAALRGTLTVLLFAYGGVHAADEVWPYPVVRGDTLIGVRDRLLQPGASWRELQRLNRIKDPRRLVPGRPLNIPLHMLREQALGAELLHTHREVTLLRDGAAPRHPQAGDTLLQGDRLRTGAQSSASLRFADGTRVLIRPDSELRIERSVRLGSSPAVDTRLRLDSGGADSHVVKQPQPRFELRTPVANLGVRGTEFRTRAEATRTLVEVLEGRVAAPTLALDAGFGALISSERAQAARPLLPAPQLSGLPTRIERLPLRLAWAAGATGTRFRAQVFAAGQAERLVLDGVFEGPLARWSYDLPDGDYELRVRALDEQGLEGRDATLRFTLKARPEPPFLTRPRAAERTADDSIVFAWTHNAAAARYRLQIADDAAFTAPRVDRSDLSGTEQREALPVGLHHWRLASIRADGDQGPFGDAQTVQRVALPPPPAAEPPQTSDAGVLLRWRADGAARFQIQVAQDDAFTQILTDQSIEQPQWLLPKPAPGQYHFRVRAIDADGFIGPWGATQRLEVPQTLQWWLLLPLLLLLP